MITVFYRCSTSEMQAYSLKVQCYKRQNGSVGCPSPLLFLAVSVTASLFEMK